MSNGLEHNHPVFNASSNFPDQHLNVNAEGPNENFLSYVQ